MATARRRTFRRPPLTFEVTSCDLKATDRLTRSRLSRLLPAAPSSTKDLLGMIHIIRGQRVMPDSDLAQLDGVATKALTDRRFRVAFEAIRQLMEVDERDVAPKPIGFGRS